MRSCAASADIRPQPLGQRGLRASAKIGLGSGQTHDWLDIRLGQNARADFDVSRRQHVFDEGDDGSEREHLAAVDVVSRTASSAV